MANARKHLASDGCHYSLSVSPKFICWNLNAWCHSIKGGAFERCLGHKSGNLMMRLVFLIKGTKEDSFTLSSMWRYNSEAQKSAIQKRALSWPYWYCALRFPASRTAINKFPIIIHPVFYILLWQHESTQTGALFFSSDTRHHLSSISTFLRYLLILNPELFLLYYGALYCHLLEQYLVLKFRTQNWYDLFSKDFSGSPLSVM